MTHFWNLVFQEQFLLYALLGGLLASISCGIIGSFVVIKKIEYIAGGIAHAVLAGMGIAYFFHDSPLIGAIIAAIICSLLIGFINTKYKKYDQTIISILWATGMAIGIVFISQTKGYTTDLMTYLFGNILLLTKENLYLLLFLNLGIVVLLTLFYKQMTFSIFDPEFAKQRGIFIGFFTQLLLFFVALTVVSVMQVVGLILTIALLSIPVAISMQFCRFLSRIMISSIFIGALATFFGLFISYQSNLPSGSMIIILLSCLFFFTLFFKMVIKKLRSYHDRKNNETRNTDRRN